MMSYPIFLDNPADVTMIEDHQNSREDGIGGNKEETVIKEGLEIEGKSLEGRLVFFDEIEGGNVGHEGCEEHVDHEDKHHLVDDLITCF